MIKKKEEKTVMERGGEKTDWTERKIRTFWRHRGAKLVTSELEILLQK